MTSLVAVRVNGRRREMPQPSTLAELVGTLGLDARYLVVEWNGEALAYAEVSRRELQEGDRLELVRPVAGG